MIYDNKVDSDKNSVCVWGGCLSVCNLIFCGCFRYEEEINCRATSENDFVLLKKVQYAMTLILLFVSNKKKNSSEKKSCLFILLLPGCG